MLKPQKLKPEARLLDAELFLGVQAEAFRGPGRSPDDIDCGIADAGQLLEPRFYLGADVNVLGAAGRGEGHVDGDVLFGLFRCVGGDGREIYRVDQAEIDNVNGDLGIVAALQGA